MSGGEVPFRLAPERPRLRRPSEPELRERVIEAWRRLAPGHPAPRSVDVLVRKKKSAVCRLRGPAGAVIAKRARRSTALLEHRLHTRVLPALPLRALAWHGMVDCDEDPERCWVFMEDAGDAAVAPRGERDEALIADWLAALHESTSRLAGSDGLPDRGPADALERLRSARTAIRAGFEQPQRPEDRAALGPLLEALAALEARWGEIEARCQALPRTLVHGDFVTKNLRVRSTSAGRELLVFDWEFAGIGFPGQDVVRVEPAHYRAALRARGGELEGSQLRRLFATGWTFRRLAHVQWTATGLGREGSEHAVAALARYGLALRADLRAEGWQAGPE